MGHFWICDAEWILTHSQQMLSAWQTDDVYTFTADADCQTDNVYASAPVNNATPFVEYEFDSNEWML